MLQWLIPELNYLCRRPLKRTLRWWWLFTLIALVVAVFSYGKRANTPEFYRAEALVIIGNALSVPDPHISEVRLGMDLALTYVELVHTYAFLDRVSQSLENPIPPESLYGLVQSSVIEDTALIRVIGYHTDPTIAAQLANATVDQLLQQSPSEPETQQQTLNTLAQRGLADLRSEQVSLENALDRTDQEIATGTLSQSEQAALVFERQSLIAQMNSLDWAINQQTNNDPMTTQPINSIAVVETARVPTVPMPKNISKGIWQDILTLLIPIMMIVMIYYYFNDTVYTMADLTYRLKLPVFGEIALIDEPADVHHDYLLPNLSANSPTVEEFIQLRARLLSTRPQQRPIYVLTSAYPGEGKSLITANLAISIALSGRNVLLIDADLRRPQQHHYFGLHQRTGLTHLLQQATVPHPHTHYLDGDTAPITSAQKMLSYDDRWVYAAHKTLIPNLTVMPAGTIPDNPAELLGSISMKHWIELFLESSYFDIVLLDTPPTLSTTDSVVVSGALSATVLVVIKSDATKLSDIKRVYQRFNSVDIPVAGTILNQVRMPH